MMPLDGLVVEAYSIAVTTSGLLPNPQVQELPYITALGWHLRILLSTLSTRAIHVALG